MISDQIKDTLVEQIIKGIIGQGEDGLKPVLLFNTAMKCEREQFLGAASHERSSERKGYANGYKPKGLQTSASSKKFVILLDQPFLHLVSSENLPLSLRQCCRFWENKTHRKFRRNKHHELLGRSTRMGALDLEIPQVRGLLHLFFCHKVIMF